MNGSCISRERLVKEYYRPPFDPIITLSGYLMEELEDEELARELALVREPVLREAQWAKSKYL